jgi:hypothetical protein
MVLFRRLGPVLVAILAAVPAFSQAVTVDVQLARLDTHLEKIRKETEFGRLVGGGSLVGMGALVGLGGTVLAQSVSFSVADDPNSSAYQTSLRNGVTAVAWIYGGALIIPGALVLLLKTDYETMPERYAAAPSGTDEEKRQKVAIGEVTLRGLADKGKFERYLTAGLLGLAGGAALASKIASPGSSYYPGTSAGGTDPALYAGILYLGAAALKAFLPSTSENENEAYLRWKQAPATF